MNEPTKAQLICDAKKLRDDITQYFVEIKMFDFDPNFDLPLSRVRDQLTILLSVNPAAQWEEKPCV